jgi:general secretion pathway protein K
MALHNDKNGFVLLVALWAIVLVSALAMATSTTFREFGGLVSVSEDRVKADALLKAGISAAAAVLVGVNNRRSIQDEEFEIKLTTGSAHVKLSDETGRININKASVEVLSALLQHVGAEDADSLAASIVAWRREDQSSGYAQAVNSPANAASPIQEGQAVRTSADATNPPPISPSFTDARQLAEIPGVNNEIVTAIEPLVTTFGEERVNALTASSEVLSALPNMTRAQVDDLVAVRRSGAIRRDQLLAILGQSVRYVVPLAHSLGRVEVRVRLPDGYAQAARATMVTVPNDKIAYRILAWTPETATSPHVRTPPNSD